MNEYIIEVSHIEYLQTIGNISELDSIFTKAKKTIVNGVEVVLVRKTGEKLEKFDKLTTLEALAEYKKQVYKYL